MKKILFCSRIFLLTVGVTIMFASVVEATSTNIQIDNTLPGIASHHIINLGGGPYTLLDTDGRVAGPNLFYSFSNFSIGANDTALFDLTKLPDLLTNVISRVTGGSESVIDGTLKMMHASAPSFFFINPSGITFNSGAKVDVPGSFYTGTASALNLSDGSQYIAYETHISTLSTANPESFGFLGNEAGSINIVGSSETQKTTLTFNPGKEVAFVANQIYIDHAFISDKKSEINGVQGNTNTEDGINLLIIATGNKIVEIKPDMLADKPITGKLTIQKSDIGVSGNGGGHLSIHSGNFELKDNSILINNNTGNKSPTGAKEININVRSDMTVDHSSIRSDSNSTGAGSPVNVDVKGSLNILDRGRIITYANPHINLNGTGAAGTITVHAGQLNIDGTKSIKKFISWSNNDTDLFDANSITSRTFAHGAAGSMKVSVDGMLTLLGTGKLASTAQGGKGSAGNVTVSAKDMIIEDSIDYSKEKGGISIRSGISAITIDSGGKAGIVDVNVTDSLKIKDGGEINANSHGTGSGGEVTVTAGQLEMSESSITSSTFGTSDGGLVKVDVTGALDLLNKSKIASETDLNNGNGGKVEVSAGQMEINHGSVSSSTVSSSAGNAGDVTVTVVDTLKITNSGSIESKTSSPTGSAGSVTVKARQIEIDGLGSQISSSAEDPSRANAGKIDVFFQDLLFLDDSSKISTTAINGNGGGITIGKAIEENGTIMKGDIVYLRNSAITTSVTGNPGGGGGDIKIGTRNLILNGGFIQANTEFGQSGGDIELNVSTLIPSGNSLTLGGEIKKLELSPRGINVIQADGKNPGDIQAPPPQLNLSGVLANLAIESFDSNTLNRNTCTVEEGNSLLQSGKGGLPIRARDFLLMPTY